VDIIAEFPERFVYIEIKEYSNPSSYNPALTKKITANTIQQKKLPRSLQQRKFNRLKDYLKHKFRDTYLFRHAEQKVHKPITYVCLITFDNALNIHLSNVLSRELPVGLASQRWKAPLATSCHVVNLATWNKYFKDWPVTQLPKNITAGGTTP
jgi:hypothetical protein